MDLAQGQLPDTVDIRGERFKVHTDFRLWMRFETELAGLPPDGLMDVSWLFAEGMPDYCSINDLLAFSRPPAPLPRQMRASSPEEIAYDFALDGDLIYAAFLGQYGIDLLTAELHWHQFLALFKGLNESTRMREVMGYRCYEPSGGSSKDIYLELKQAWRIERESPWEQAEAEKFSSYFT